MSARKSDDGGTAAALRVDMADYEAVVVLRERAKLLKGSCKSLEIDIEMKQEAIDRVKEEFTMKSAQLAAVTHYLDTRHPGWDEQ